MSEASQNYLLMPHQCIQTYDVKLIVEILMSECYKLLSHLFVTAGWRGGAYRACESSKAFEICESVCFPLRASS